MVLLELREQQDLREPRDRQGLRELLALKVFQV
jgi:hypothetical protein